MRRIIQVIWAGLAALFIIPVIGGFFSEWAKERGWYEDPSARVETAMNWALSLGADPTYRIAAAFVCGAALGMTLDWLLRRRDQHGTATTSEPDESEGGADYAHGLALERVQPSLDLGNLQNTLETRLVLRNASGVPLRFLIERFDVVMHDNVVKCSGIAGIIAKDGEITVLPNRGFTKKQYAGFAARGVGSVEYSILYGHSDKEPSRRAYKLMHLDLFKKKNGFFLKWLVQNETDEAI